MNLMLENIKLNKLEHLVQAEILNCAALCFGNIKLEEYGCGKCEHGFKAEQRDDH